MHFLKKSLIPLAVMGLIFTSYSCSKQDELTSSNNGYQSADEQFSSCSLSSYSGTGYIPLAEELFGDFNTTQNGTHDTYVSCTYPTPASGTCCSSRTIWLDGGGGLGAYSTTSTVFEDWGDGYGGTADPLSDGVMTVAEQEAFIDRVIDHAEAVSLSCTGGTLKPYSFEFSFTYISGTGVPSNASPIVKVSYSPTCTGGGGTQ